MGGLIHPSFLGGPIQPSFSGRFNTAQFFNEAHFIWGVQYGPAFLGDLIQISFPGRFSTARFSWEVSRLPVFLGGFLQPSSSGSVSFTGVPLIQIYSETLRRVTKPRCVCETALRCSHQCQSPQCTIVHLERDCGSRAIPVGPY